MRVIVLLVVALVCASGPFLYLTRGRHARDLRREAAARIQEQRAEVERILAQEGGVPTLEQKERAERELVELQRAIRKAVLAAAPREPPDLAALARVAAASDVADAVLSPALAGLGDGEEHAMRRAALHAVLVAASRSKDRGTMDFLDIHVDEARPHVDLPSADVLRRVPVRIRATGDPARVVAFLEFAIEGSGESARADLREATFAALRPEELARSTAESPPIRVEATVDILLAGRGERGT